MELQTSYAFGRTVAASFSEVELKVRAALAREGFGILTEFKMRVRMARVLAAL